MFKEGDSSYIVCYEGLFSKWESGYLLMCLVGRWSDKMRQLDFQERRDSSYIYILFVIGVYFQNGRVDISCF